jgi:membrane-associated phospholipid phosphatase
VNLVVGVLKISLGRGQPEAANPSFFVGGMAYPSGHTANILLVYGLAAYLLGRYRQVGRTARLVMWGLVALLSVTMVATSLTLNWHWFADLVAGLLIGATVLEMVVAADAGISAAALDHGPARLARDFRRRGTPPPRVVGDDGAAEGDAGSRPPVARPRAPHGEKRPA